MSEKINNTLAREQQATIARLEQQVREMREGLILLLKRVNEDILHATENQMEGDREDAEHRRLIIIKMLA